MMPFDNIDSFIIETIFTSNASTDFWMSSFDVMIHSFSEIMEESSLECEYWISTDELGDRLSNIGDFLAMHEDILSITRTKSEFSNEWYDFFWDSDNSHLIDGFSSQVIDEFISILLVFFYDFFDTSGLDTLIEDEIFE